MSRVSMVLLHFSNMDVLPSVATTNAQCMLMDTNGKDR